MSDRTPFYVTHPVGPPLLRLIRLGALNVSLPSDPLSGPLSRTRLAFISSMPVALSIGIVRRDGEGYGL